jgi:hypothetical protein
MKILTGKALSRRTLLRGLGATVALPLLDAMFPGVGRGQSVIKRPHRFQAIYVPNGMAMQYWTPSKQPANFRTERSFEEPLHQLMPILEPLAPYKDRLTQFSGLRATWVNVHAGASGSWLNGTDRGGETEVDIFAQTSVDQMLAREFGRETQLGSLQVSLNAPALAGSCSIGQSCVYTYTVSWASPTQALPMEYNPRSLFERLFGDAGSTERSAREARLRQQRSILDSVSEDLAALNRRIGPEDNIRIEQFASSIRDVERRIQMAEAQTDIELPVMDQPQGAPADFEEHAKLMMDLQLLALQTDLTRVITFMIGNELSGRQYPQTGVTEAHHPLSHHNQSPVMVEKMSRINTYHVQLLAWYLAKLDATPDVDGSLLDNMTVMYGGGISNSSGHAGDNLPVILVGGGAGTLRRGGRHLTYAGAPPLANMLVSLMHKFDLPIDRVGSSTGALAMDELTGV